MKLVAIIQARMGSSRLPGKVLKDLGGKTVLARVVSRVRRVKPITEILIATSTASGDDAIVEECNRLAVNVYRGEEHDVLDRYYRAAVSVRAECVVRITSDCPLIDPEISTWVIESFLEKKPDYASNALERSFPRGLDTEVMAMAALQQAWREAREEYQRAHVTPYIYQNPAVFRILALKGNTDYSQHRWTLDTPEDLQFLQAVFHRFQGRDDFSWLDVLASIEREPGLAAINSKVAQKALQEG